MVITPDLAVFNPTGSLFMPQHNLIESPLSAEKISLSLSHLVPEILVSKVSLISYQMYYLTVFKHFILIFCLIFNPIDLPFS